MFQTKGVASTGWEKNPIGKKKALLSIVTILLFTYLITWGTVEYSKICFPPTWVRGCLELLSYGMIFLFVFLMIRKFLNSRLSDFGFSFSHLWIQIVIGVTIPVLDILNKLYNPFIYYISSHEAYPVSYLLFQLFAQLFFVALVEELIFRGVLLNLINVLMPSKVMTILISSALFGLPHLVITPHVLAFIQTFLIGVVLSALRIYLEKYVKLPTTILAHFLINVIPLFI